MLELSELVCRAHLQRVRAPAPIFLKAATSDHCIQDNVLTLICIVTWSEWDGKSDNVLATTLRRMYDDTKLTVEEEQLEG